jgi:hypothetical protein
MVQFLPQVVRSVDQYILRFTMSQEVIRFTGQMGGAGTTPGNKVVHRGAL